MTVFIIRNIHILRIRYFICLFYHIFYDVARKLFLDIYTLLMYNVSILCGFYVLFIHTFYGFLHMLPARNMLIYVVLVTFDDSGGR